ncbi:type IX secretion system membrane protein PorP/SprF [Flavobacterium sp. Fl-77]|uniref:Type IX secretion system membrane protein PorP/SprF n=1 Tax=Flavobacterium flavipigmentatum TaxID=2893884 RepID=A0AAJ2VXG1_9FLAO|nr:MULTISPECIES: type IX secretion system membrane protein PorP/SprF [unclassified Flavobacterium]MDX6182627.1 type IX secretion system membrane protein PorP/SprF [Flavobacterium sp. Fl-33]MDX6186193.1 type IX secretion system membrane protein PorP/SprF [Flavobacterium sp. Fl-77]UFH38340.1 type IX secretion system membrane protein PorP/SprF [Flavobacterium sp. F-70]
MRTKLFSFVLIFTAIVSHAQQDAQFTQYMYNTININPAYAGSRGALSIFGLYRTQWVGLDGAPVTSSFSINTPINNSNLGVGISLVNDKIGPTNENNFSIDLSYTVQTSADFKLSFGIKGTGNLFNLDINKLNPENQGDIQFQDFDSKFSPNIGAGVYWHSSKAYIGLSVPNFIETNRYNDNDIAIYRDKINYYLMGGLVFNLDDYGSIKFKPAVLAKMVEGAPLQADISANFMFMDKFVVGAAYRWNAAFSAMAGFQINDAMYIGYGYDRETTQLNNYNSGSHEIFLRYELFKNNDKMTTPRFF